MPIRDLMARLIDDGAIPPFVYTYPPRSTYRPPQTALDPLALWRDDFAHTATNALNLYIHVPFCRYKCGFCNLYTVISTDLDLYDAYTDAICSELDFYRPVIESRDLRTIYIGGGTPSLLQPKHFEQIFAKLDEIYPNWRAVTLETAIEASPDSIVDSAEPNIVEHLMGLGLTRVNMGVQSLKRAELKEAGRARAGEDVVRRAVAVVKALGLPNLSTDLIMGFAGQTDESWAESVQELVALAPDTISTYFLTIRPDAWFAKTGRYAYSRDPKLYDRYDVAREAMLAAGYVQESNVRYKRPGRGGYWQKVLQFQGTPILGVGAGARTYTNTADYIVGGSHKPDLAQVAQYIRQINGDGPTIEAAFLYDDEERIRKRMVLHLFDLDLAHLERYGASRFTWIEELIEAAIDLELAQMVGRTRVQLTARGYKYRDIISWLTFSERVVELDRQFYEGIHRADSRIKLRSPNRKADTSVPVAV